MEFKDESWEEMPGAQESLKTTKHDRLYAKTMCPWSEKHLITKQPETGFSTA
jgi:hypothetical protein